VLWAVLGVSLLCLQAIVRLLPKALEPIRDGSLGVLEAALYLAWSVANAYAEGYRGFQKAFAPRVVARALYLAAHPRPLRVALAPLFCMGLFGATRRRMVVSWTIVFVVTLLVAGMRFVPQPWRGIIDGGVVVGLVWGTLAIIAYGIAALAGHEPDAHADVAD
jgi:hypothetical protein